MGDGREGEQKQRGNEGQGLVEWPVFSLRAQPRV